MVDCAEDDASSLRGRSAQAGHVALDSQRRPTSTTTTTPASQCCTSTASWNCDRAGRSATDEMTSGTSARGRASHDDDHQPRTASSRVQRCDAPPPRRAIYSIAEHDELEQQQSGRGPSTIQQVLHDAESGTAGGRPSSGAGWTGGGRTDVWDWCRRSDAADDAGAGGDALDVGTYIRRDDVRKLLELRRRQRTSSSSAAAAAVPATNASAVQSWSAADPAACRRAESSARWSDLGGSSSGSIGVASRPGSSSDAGSSRLPAVAHPAVDRRPDCAVVESRAGLERGCGRSDAVPTAGPPAGCDAAAAAVADASPSSSTGALDSVSVGSYKDSGYRSEDDRASAAGHSAPAVSPTLTATNSAASLTVDEAAARPDVRSLCSSFESLCSVQSGLSLPVSLEPRRRTGPPLQMLLPSDGAPNAARLRHLAESLYIRSASGQSVSGRQRPLKADHGAAAAAAASSRPGSASSRLDDGSSARPASARRMATTSMFPGPAASDRGGGCLFGVRHSESVPAVNRLEEIDHRPTAGPARFVDLPQSRRTAATARHPGGMQVPPAGQQPVPRRADPAEQSGDRRVRGRGYFRHNGGVVPLLRQPPSPSPSAAAASCEHRRSHVAANRHPCN